MMAVLYAFTFVHGLFAAGLIPVLAAALPGRSSWAFAAYFAGLVHAATVSDPGMLLGAALAAGGEPSLLALAALCLVPLFRRTTP